MFFDCHDGTYCYTISSIRELKNGKSPQSESRLGDEILWIVFFNRFSSDNHGGAVKSTSESETLPFVISHTSFQIDFFSMNQFRHMCVSYLFQKFNDDLLRFSIF